MSDAKPLDGLQRLLQTLPRATESGEYIPPPAFPAVTLSDVREAVLDLLARAATQGTFTSLSYPCWSGWATAEAVAWHLPEDIREAPVTLPRDLAPARGIAWASAYVEPVMLRMGQRTELEMRRIHPLRFKDDPDAQKVECWAFRLPGDAGYCRWVDDPPVEMPRVPGVPTLDGTVQMALESRQVRELMQELEEMGCTLPPYWVSRIQRVVLRDLGKVPARSGGRSHAARHSGLRSIR